MNPIEELKDEHRGIETALRVLESMAGRLDQAPNAELVRDGEALIDFFRTFSDACHHGKEEKLLFPALERIGVSRQGGPIGVMLAEHDQGRGHVRGMAAALKSLQEDNPAAARSFREHALAYIHLLRQHIDKENRVLFQIADQHLSDPAKQELAEQFEEVEQKIIGAGKHEQYHALLETLAERYR